MRRLTVSVAAILFLTLVAQGQSRQPCLPPAVAATSEPNIFTEQQERDLGDAIAEHIIRDFRVIDDDEVTGHLNRIGRRLVNHLPQTNLRFLFHLVDMPDANAFVLPGGRVYVARKLVALAQSEDELAGVIAHEIGHLVARQASIDMTRILREVLGITEVRDRKDIFDKYNQLMENAARKPRAFGREDREKGQVVADQIGLFALAGAGYDPQAQPRFFDRAPLPDTSCHIFMVESDRQ
jgi:predicted Zn-dependent protease